MFKKRILLLYFYVIKSMSFVVLHIRDFFVSLHGALLVKEPEIPEDLKDIHNSVYGDSNSRSIYEDRINLHNDFVNFKKDFKTSIRKYREEVLNG